MSEAISAITRVTRPELMRVLGVSDETVRNYTKAGMPVTGKGNGARYPLAECVKWVQQFEVQKALKSGKKPENDDLEALELRMKLAKVQQAEYETALVLGSMVRIEDADRDITTRLEAIRAKLLAIPAVWAPQILGLKAIPDAVDLLGDLVYVLMDSIANEPLEEADGNEPTESDESESGDDDEEESGEVLNEPDA